MAKGFKSGGRQKGTPNKNTGVLRDQITDALDELGGVKWLVWLGQNKPESFASLLGRVLPMQVTGANDGPLVVTWESPKD